MQPLVGSFLVQLEVGGGMEGDRAAAPPVGMEAKRDLLRHRPGRHESRRLLAEEIRHALLESLDELTAAVYVGGVIRHERVREPLEGRLRRADGRTAAVEEALAP